MSLSVCSGCSRHVRERECPFCGCATHAASGPSLVRAIVVVGITSAMLASTTACYGGAAMPVAPMQQGPGDAAPASSTP